MKYNIRSIRKMRNPSHYEYSLKFIEDQLFDQCGFVLSRRDRYIFGGETVIEIGETTTGIDVKFLLPENDPLVKLYFEIGKLVPPSPHCKFFCEDFDFIVTVMRKYIDDLNESSVFSKSMWKLVRYNAN